MRKIALQTSADGNYGLAISPDSAHMVASHGNATLSVYSLPGGEHIRTFGSCGTGKGQFKVSAKLCFSAAGNILVADNGNKRVQEVTLTGGHVRFIGVGVIDDEIWGIAANAELIVVGKYFCTSNNRVMMFDAVTGALVMAFGDYGNAPGQLMRFCSGIRFSPDSRHIVVAESKGFCFGGRLSMFTLAGEFVKCIGEGELKATGDVEFADEGDLIVCDNSDNVIRVYAADNGSTLLRHWTVEMDVDNDMDRPLALAMGGDQLYVLCQDSDYLRVFE